MIFSLWSRYTDCGKTIDFRSWTDRVEFGRWVTNWSSFLDNLLLRQLFVLSPLGVSVPFLNAPFLLFKFSGSFPLESWARKGCFSALSGRHCLSIWLSQGREVECAGVDGLTEWRAWVILRVGWVALALKGLSSRLLILGPLSQCRPWELTSTNRRSFIGIH